MNATHRILGPVALGLLLLAGCGDRRCCKTEDCSEGDSSTTGSSVLRFRGEVPTNLLFLSIDTLRKDHMGFHGNQRDLTPFLDRIANEGVVMTDHVQCSNWTYGSTTCTLAGATNIDRGHMPRLNGTDKQRPPVPEGSDFLASWLGEAGMKSALVTSNSWMSEENGNTQGYTNETLTGGTADELLLQGQSKIRNVSDGGKHPWFLHVHVMEPHAAYNPPAQFIDADPSLEPWPEDLTKRKKHYGARDTWGSMTDEEQELLEAHLRQLYDGEIRALDSRVEDAWTELESNCWLDDTLVVIWSDHGEAFWEHGFQTHAFNLTAEENDGVLVFWSKNIEPGRHVGTTSAIDLVPTLLDLYDIRIPDEVTGYPIGTAPDDRPVFADSLARTQGAQFVMRDGVKLHYNWTAGSLRMWDRNDDPNEKKNIFDPDDPLAQELWGLLRPQVEAMAPLVVGGSPAPILPPDM